MAQDEPEILLTFWGKTPRPQEPPDQFHPALYHMLDVAFVAEILLSEQAAPRPRQALAHAWAGVSLDQFFAWLPFLIALHDLGKISAAFQGQVEYQRERLEQTGITFPPKYEKAPYHAEIGVVWVQQNLMKRESGMARRLVWAVRDVIGGHHGRFTQERLDTLAARLRKSERGCQTEWEAWREAAYTLLRQILEPSGDPSALGTPHHLRPATVVLTGFLVLCDWIGSNGDYFPASPDVPLTDYRVIGRERAGRAIDLVGLRMHRVVPAYTTFTTYFPDIEEPRPLQRAIDDLPAEMIGVPMLAVIEAPTGEGKTEAALALAQRLGAADGLDELFFALPTMATSNQMYTRLSEFYDRLYGAAVRLTHSQSAIVEEDLRRASLAGDQDGADPQAASALAAIEWFAGSKKAMLAPFGVGTVDQVELAGLNVRHYMLRLVALSRKVVIIDEVHAYDTYMSVILAHTLAWLASLGTSVILLSATLPTTRHRDLAASYFRGLGKGYTPPEIPDTLDYPAISLYRATSSHRKTSEVFRPDQRLTLRLSPAQPDQEADALLDLVRDGGAVARICNRVDDAQAIYRALLTRLPTDQRVLIHARFPLHQRQKLEARVDTLVGKKTTRPPDLPVIIVGTQVLEQSLDYDVDVMVTDFAPIDLLLQRAGRLHRHSRVGKRPPRHQQPVMQVVLPLSGDGLPVWKRWAPIYDPYILWRTWEVLCEGADEGVYEIVLPRDYRKLIEAIYQDEPRIPSDAAHTAAMRNAWAKLQQQQGEMRSQAQQQLTPAVDRSDAIIETGDIAFVEDEDGKLAGWQIAKTRLGDRITVVPLYRFGEVLSLDPHPGSGWELSADIPPMYEELKALLQRSLPISDPTIIAEFRDEQRQDVRWPWGQVPLLLRSLFPLVLDPTTRATRFDKRTVYLDDDLGLVIEKERI